MEWQPIETAPEDYRELLLYFPKQVGRNALPAITKVERYPCGYPRKPTHWMPLPEPPNADS